jgi:peptide-methionine (S)-S-oxide reductase
VDGVIRTRVGYAGGRAENPNYGKIGDHTETVQVDYDPARISYERLLEIFWESHQPTRSAWSRQYMNAVFYRDDRQRRLAEASKAEIRKKIGSEVKTEVLPIRSFTMAEDYHQKYILKRYEDLKKELARIYPERDDFVDSTAVARLNGYAGGNGGKERLEREIDLLGLSEEGKRVLRRMVSR